MSDEGTAQEGREGGGGRKEGEEKEEMADGGIFGMLYSVRFCIYFYL
jgi:hypothetical protein